MGCASSSTATQTQSKPVEDGNVTDKNVANQEQDNKHIEEQTPGKLFS